MRKFLHVSRLTCPLSGSVQLYTTMVKGFDISILQFYIPEMKEVVTIVLRNCTLPDEGPLRPETCSILRVLKHYCDYNEVCWLTLSKEYFTLMQ
jgi:hypothetical protein